jgi:hypothetical protein
VGYQTLYFDVTQGSGGKEAPCKFENVRQIFFVSQLVNRGASNHSFNGHLRPNRRHLNGVAIFEPLDIRLYSMEQEIVNVDGLNQLVATIMIQDS